MASRKQFLKRYTNIPSLLYILRRHQITLLDPATWDDQNDSHYLTIYREKKSLKTVLALCFSQAPETYHHWHVYAEGPAGICITFHRDPLVAALRKKTGVTAKRVKYLTLAKMNAKAIAVSELPFLKRAPYADEDEFRAIYESKTKKVDFLDVPIPLDAIETVTLSPWTPKSLADTLKETIADIPDCVNIRVVRSTLISNERWKNYGEDAV